MDDSVLNSLIYIWKLPTTTKQNKREQTANILCEFLCSEWFLMNRFIRKVLKKVSVIGINRDQFWFAIILCRFIQIICQILRYYNVPEFTYSFRFVSINHCCTWQRAHAHTNRPLMCTEVYRCVCVCGSGCGFLPMCIASVIMQVKLGKTVNSFQKYLM